MPRAGTTQQLGTMVSREGAPLCLPLPFDFNEGTSWQPLAPGLGHESSNSESLRSSILNN